ncbi:exocyst complex component 3-like protein 4 isoform X2 [Gadus macrocephalus]|uniref:exocyst complex component 3-like protein 4 isoform X2 n=1 Tax=Gadus macrocephalus TaxID=80720 RepID=UPI0028CBA2BC|nr:exocyst complex component 3-like protein 4 isoform X2 [Gadus macrocephalus]
MEGSGVGGGSPASSGPDLSLNSLPPKSFGRLSGNSSLTSPLKTSSGLFQKKEDGRTGETQGNGLRHSKTLPEMASPDGFFSFGSIRRSLRLSKKDKEKEQKKEKERGEKVPEEEEEEEEEKEKMKMKEVVDKREEVSEFYTLPEVLSTPLSVMEINRLIEGKILGEAHLNLLSLRQDFQEAQGGGGEGSVELCRKEKDLHLLYRALRDKLKAVVRDASDPHLLLAAARIVQEEERREGQPGGLGAPGGWRGVWREAVGEGVHALVAGVPLDGPEQEPAWLGVHLGLLGRALVQHLEKVKRDLRWAYPPSFQVFSAYVGAQRLEVGQHVTKLQPQVKELKDLYALLNWILNSYQSEKIMGSPCLHPEMKSESMELILDEAFLDQLRDKYCSRIQIDLRFSLEKIIEMEKEFWREEKSYELEEGCLSSPSELDIRTRVQGIVTWARRLDAHLELKAIRSCCEELKLFPKRFEEALMSCCSSAEVNTLTPALRAMYLITSINTFILVKQHMEQHRASCPEPVADFSQEVDLLLGRLALRLEDQYKDDIEPYMRRMMTRKWLTKDEDFKRLQSRTELLSKQCSQMRPPTVQGLVDRLHHHAAKDYIAQLMKNSYSCKNRKHQKGAEKLRRQWEELSGLFIDMNSTHEWLRPLGDHLSEIIGRVDKKDIKDHLQPLVEQYPDMREKHLAAILYFRGLIRGRERQAVLRRFSELQKEAGPRAAGASSRAAGASSRAAGASSRAAGASSRSLFRDIQPAGNPGWTLPLGCLGCGPS